MPTSRPVGNAPEVSRTIGVRVGRFIVVLTRQGVAIVKVTVAARYPIVASQ